MYDENASIYRIRKYFTDDGWTQVMQLIKTKKNNATYYCKMCEKILEGESICCDSCLEWLHLSCAGLQKTKRPPQGVVLSTLLQITVIII